ncbi:carbohydrate kinase family protein [Kaistia dalseonensis]|uniref:Sugar/nucleoside kinase (Ribokinase family) n=1 Tax=Kaistia dalseonensis TaxID=410840 RepID=A0ABU0H7N9_9HYPH|nr:carbohydrate kinase family protein [Kaistia dalseonensis]MCX5495322.1 carbohydrate kinase family protein [Kaistia dalseonensis]MDQ0437908.1 sugar/nucleoside kinase (ribokinase family) [Kaistia dalseonensis]
MTRPHVYCLGTVVLDRIVEVDRLPGPDDKVFVKAKREGPGGPARNAAAALAAWGETVSLASVVGDDPIGMKLLARLDDESIGSEAIDVLPDLETAATLIMVDDAGERAIVIEPVPDAVLAKIGRSLKPAAGDAVVANFFHVEALASTFDRARQAGAFAVLDLELPELLRWGWDAAFRAAASADVVITNSQVVRAFAEREGLVSASAEDVARSLASRLRPAGGRVCVTLGAAGVVAREGDALMRVAALPVKPRDTTGAGDRFMAGLVRALLDGAMFDVALRRAVAAAGLLLSGDPHDWGDAERAARSLTLVTLGEAVG